jgi:TonB family protein
MLFGAAQEEPTSFKFVFVILAFVAVGAGAYFFGRSSAAPEVVEAAPVVPVAAAPVAELTLELRGYQSLTFIATSSGPRFDLVQRLRKGTGRVTLAPVRPEPVAEPRAAATAAVPPPLAVSLPEPIAPVVAEPAVVIPEAAPPVLVAAAAPPTSGSGLVPLDQVSVRPRMINGGQPPRYTRDAVAAKIEGTSVARCRVTVTGSLTDCHITKSVPMLDDAVMQSLTTRQYEPAKVGANPVETEISIVTRLTAR